MPIYVYEREDGTSFERLQKVSDDILTECPETGQKVQRKITAPAVHFKGTGFYQTDYKSSGAPSSSSSSNSSSGESGESSTKSGDSPSSDSSSASSGGDSSSDSGSCNGTGPTGGCPSCSTSDSSTD